MKNKKLIVATLFLLGYFVASQGIPVPVLALIGNYLKITNKSTLSLILTLPSLFMIPMMLLTGVLAARMSKKILAYVGGGLFLIGAFGPIFTDNFTWILVWRAILGLGLGIFFPLTYAMIPDYFEGPSRHTVMGIINGGSGVWAAVCAVAAGIVGKVTWQHAFYLYLFGLVPILFVFFFLPGVKKAEPTLAAAGEKKSGAPAPSTYAYAFALFVAFATLQIVGNVISSFIVGEGLGSASTAGNAMGMETVGCFSAGFCFGPLFGFFKKWSSFAGLAVSAAGFVMLSISPSVPMVMVSVVLIGFGMGFFAPLLMTLAAKSSPNAVSLAYAITQVGMMFGMFASSFFLQLFAMLGGSAARRTFVYSGVMLGAMAVVFFVAALRSSEEVPAMQEEELAAN